jgi:hypothetical protein
MAQARVPRVLEEMGQRWVEGRVLVKAQAKGEWLQERALVLPELGKEGVRVQVAS